MAEAIKKLKVGLIGCGRVSVMHLVSIAALKETEIVACCDIKKERADETAKNPFLSQSETRVSSGKSVLIFFW